MKHVHKNSKQLTLVNCNPLRVLLNSLRGSVQKMQPDLTAIRTRTSEVIRISHLVKYVRIGCEIALENAFMIRVCVGESGAQSNTFFSKA